MFFWDLDENTEDKNFRILIQIHQGVIVIFDERLNEKIRAAWRFF